MPENHDIPEGMETEVLAAEYVLGVLDAHARSGVEARLASDAALAAAVALWNERLLPLALQIPEAAPPPWLWARIADALPKAAPAPRAPVTPARSTSLWDSLAFWRLLTAGALAAAVVALVAPWRTPDTPAAPVVVAPPAAAPAAPSHAAVVATDTGVHGWIASVHDNRMRVATAPDAPQEPGRVPELWIIPEGGTAISLGLLPERGVVELTLSDDIAALLDRPVLLAVTMEPPGGAPQGVATGPVVAKGTLFDI